jgi:quercetin dioxygenase-like cupin family protein
MKTAIAVAAAAMIAHGAPASDVHDATPPQETTTRIFERDLPNAPGKALVAVEVVYPPGGASPSHTHAESSFIYAYVLSGAIVSAVDDEAPRVYRAGQSWHELPGARHRVSRNASRTEPARLLAIFVVNPGERELSFPERE